MNVDDAPPPPRPPLVLTVGRVNLDLYVEQLGVAMADAATFRASVGGSPTNIAIVARRLGVPAAVLSAAGTDPAGDVVLRQLGATGVDTRWIGRLPAGSTSMALLATLSADRGERQFYRHDPTDAHVNPQAVPGLPWDSLRLVALSADALALGTMADTVRAVGDEALRRGIPVWWDLDLRPNSWDADPARYRAVVAPALEHASVVIGTEDEYAMLFGLQPDDVSGVEQALTAHPFPQAVLKRGARGAALFVDGQPRLSVPAITVDPVCTVGGGDAVAGTLVAARLAGRDWPEALDLAMRVAGWTVQQPYCSTGFPTPAQLGIAPLGPAPLHELTP